VGRSIIRSWLESGKEEGRGLGVEDFL